MSGATWRRPRFPLFIVLVLVLAGCAIESVTEPHTFDPALEPTPVPTAVAVAKPTYIVERGTVVSNLTLGGRVVPAAQTVVSFPIEGLIAAVAVERGDAVQAGEPLAELDRAAYEAERLLAQTALDVAQAQVAALESRQQNDRRRAEIALQQRQLQLDFAISQGGSNPSAAQQLNIDLLALDVEMAQLAFDELRAGVDPALLAEVQQAQLELDRLDSLIAQTHLIAPVSGTVVQQQIDAGDMVAAGETVIAIADLSDLEVESLVREPDLREMVEGMTVTVNFAAQPGRSYELVLDGLPPPYGTAADLPESTARFAFTDPADIRDFAVGDRVVVDLILAQNDDTLWLPQAAIRDFSGRNFVVIQDGTTQRRVDVQLGLANDSRVEILEGVEEGDVVVGP